MRAVARGLLVVVAWGALTGAALACVPPLLGETQWPFGPLTIQGGQFTPREGATVDLDAAADSARAALPGHAVVVLDWADEPALIVGRVDGPTSPQALRDWRDAAQLPLAGPEQIGYGCSAPDWFSRPRRWFDVGVTAAALVVAATGVLLATRVKSAHVA